jgi:hypothetical protein
MKSLAHLLTMLVSCVGCQRNVQQDIYSWARLECSRGYRPPHSHEFERLIVEAPTGQLDIRPIATPLRVYRLSNGCLLVSGPYPAQIACEGSAPVRLSGWDCFPTANKAGTRFACVDVVPGQSGECSLALRVKTVRDAPSDSSRNVSLGRTDCGCEYTRFIGFDDESVIVDTVGPAADTPANGPTTCRWRVPLAGGPSTRSSVSETNAFDRQTATACEH